MKRQTLKQEVSQMKQMMKKLINENDLSSMDSISDNDENSKNNYEDIIDILLDRYDGPVTKFVVLSRAVRLAAKEKYYSNHNFTADDITNALDIALNRLESNEGELDSQEY